jgi:glycosyltransferase involved in cell wall biosynthesis
MAQGPLHLLCIEPRFPGRLGAIADWLVRRRGHRCSFYCAAVDPQPHWPESTGKGLEIVRFNVGGVAREAAVAWTRYLERGLCYAYGCWETLHARRPQSIDLILGRSAGLGSTLFASVALPRVPIVNFFDYYYQPRAHDLAEEEGARLPASYVHWRQAANAMDLLDLENGVHAWTSSRWQRELFPEVYRPGFTVMLDGVEARRFARPAGSRTAPKTIAGRTLPADAKLVTFVGGSVDRLRGFDRFVDLANRLLRARSDVICAVAGGPIVQRGLDVHFFNKDYRAHLLAQTPLHDPSRVWFLDMAQPAVVADLLTASDLHVYPSRPYPVARSLLEALAAGCVVLASATDPVREFVTDGQTGLLVPAADSEAWEKQALAVLQHPAAHRPLGEAAAKRVRDQYAFDVTLPCLAEWFDRLAR